MTPFNPDYSHFTADITTRTMDYGEDIYTARASGRWYFAMTMRERGTTNKLFECRDAGFPPGHPEIGGKPCLRYITSTM